MMALDAPSPFAGLRWAAKDGEEVPSWIADHAPPFFELLQDDLQAHDRGRLGVAVGTGASSYQFLGGRLLFLGHLLETKPLAARLSVAVLQRDEMPIRSFLIIKGKRRLAFLLGRQ